VGCGGQQNGKATVAERIIVGSDTLVSANYDLLKDTVVVPLSSLLSDFSIVCLDNTSDEAIVGSGAKVFVSERYIGVFSSASGYRLFDRQGKYLTEVSSSGQGPYEYVMPICDSYIDDSGTVYLMPWMDKKLIAYDIQKDQYRAIPLTYMTTKATFTIDAEKERLSIANLAFPGAKSVAWVQDLAGNLIEEVSAANYIIPQPDFGNEMASAFCTEAFDVLFWTWTDQPILDTLYHYDTTANRLKPVYTAYPQKEGAAFRPSFVELPDYYLTTVQVEDKLIQINQSTIILDGEQVVVAVDKHDLSGFYADLRLDMLGGLTTPKFPPFRRGYYADNRDPIELKDALEDLLAKETDIIPEQRAQLEALAASLNDNSNNVLFVGKLKREGESSFEGKIPVIHQTKSKAQTDVSQTSEAMDDDNKLYRFDDLRDKLKEEPQFNDILFYLKANNRYQNWDINDKRLALVQVIVEKDGTISEALLTRSTGNQELDEEALRLARGAKGRAAIDRRNRPVRMRDYSLQVSFPPTEPQLIK
jgi:TonB family protein